MNAYVEMLLVFVLPVILWAIGLVQSKHRHWALICMAILASCFILYQKWSWEKLGFRIDNLRQTLPIYILATLVSIIFLTIFSKILKRKYLNIFHISNESWFWVTIGAFLQEFLYRAYLIPKSTEILSSLAWIIFLNAILFLLAHLIYPEAKANLPLVFLSGIMFATLYWFYPNLILISLMHMMLNFLATSYGFATPEPQFHRT